VRGAERRGCEIAESDLSEALLNTATSLGLLAAVTLPVRGVPRGGGHGRMSPPPVREKGKKFVMKKN